GADGGFREGSPGDRPMGAVHGIAGPARRPLTVRAARTAVLLSVLFVVVYGSTNWFTARYRAAEVGTWCFPWELTAVPYVPLLIVLCTRLAEPYGRHTRGGVRVVSYTWFGLIAASTVLTWQHHLVDVAGGFVLAAFAFYLFRDLGARLPVVPNVRVGGYYAAG